MLGPMPTRHAPRRVDANQKAIVAALRKAGGSRITVVSSADLGQGFPDLILGIDDRWIYLAEVKDGAKAPSAQRLTDPQIDFIAKWRGRPVVLFYSVDQAVDWLRATLAEPTIH